jgi:hypothetical protein
MGPYLGDFKEDTTLYFCWDTNDKSGTSITRSTNGTIQVYKDDGTSESTAGITDTEDFDSLTGIHNCKIDLSTVLATFSIENRFASSSLFKKAAKLLVNKAVQNKATGVIDYYDDDGQTVILSHTPADGESTITRTPS